MSPDIIEVRQQYQDAETFNRLKNKIAVKEGKSSSQGGYPHISRDGKQPFSFTPGKGNHPSFGPTMQNGGVQCLKIELRNGSFIRPKNYMITDNRTMKVSKKWSG